MQEWGDHAKKLMIQKVDIYDRCPSLDVAQVAILDCYMDVVSNRTQEGMIPWNMVFIWCDCYGVSDREYYLNVIKVIEAKINEWQRATSNSGNTPPRKLPQ